MSDHDEGSPDAATDKPNRPLAGIKLLGGSLGCLALVLVAVVVALVLLGAVLAIFLDDPVWWIAFIALVLAVSGFAAGKRRT